MPQSDVESDWLPHELHKTCPHRLVSGLFVTKECCEAMAAITRARGITDHSFGKGYVQWLVYKAP